MSSNYKVVKFHATANEVTLRRGNLRQCWVFVRNTYAEDTTATDMAADGVCIVPDNGGK